MRSAIRLGRTPFLLPLFNKTIKSKRRTFQASGLRLNGQERAEKEKSKPTKKPKGFPGKWRGKIGMGDN